MLRTIVCPCLLAALLLGGCSTRESPPAPTPAPVDCARFSGFSEARRLGGYAWRARFATDLSRVLLVTTGWELRIVALPSLETQVLPGVMEVEWLGAEAGLLLADTFGVGHSLAVSWPPGDPPRTVARNVSDHVASPDGRTLYVIQDYANLAGTLSSIDTATGSARELAKKVGGESVKVARDGRLAYLTGRGPSPSCSDVWVGELHVVGTNGETSTRASVLCAAFLGDALVWLEAKGCEVSLWASEAGKQPARVADGIGAAGFHATAPDGSALLALGERKLTAITATGARLLADDLFVSMDSGFPPWPFWAFTADSKHVVYTPGAELAIGLAAVELASATRRPLATLLGERVQVALSPVGSTVVFLDRGSSPAALRLATLGTPEERMLASLAGEVTSLRVHAERGVLYAEQASGRATLRYLPIAGGAASALGSWSVGTPSFVETVEVDPAGCTVLFNADDGAQLRSLPR